MIFAAHIMCCGDWAPEPEDLDFIPRPTVKNIDRITGKPLAAAMTGPVHNQKD